MSGRNVQSSPSKRKSQREEGMPGIMISTERIRERSVMSATIRTHTMKAEHCPYLESLKEHTASCRPHGIPWGSSELLTPGPGSRRFGEETDHEMHAPRVSQGTQGGSVCS